MMKRGRKRVLVSVVVWLSIGLALAVVSAMGLTVRSRFRDVIVRDLPELQMPKWPEESPVGWTPPTNIETSKRFGGECISAVFHRLEIDSERGLVPDPQLLEGESVTSWMSYWRVGWPMRSFKSLTIHEYFYVGQGTDIRVRQLWSIPLPMRYGLQSGSGIQILLPIRPMWPGLLVNTLFFAALVWVPFKGVGFVRRANRRKRGRCIGCGYDLRGSAAAAVCPECGRGVLGAVVADGSAGV